MSARVRCGVYCEYFLAIWPCNNGRTLYSYDCYVYWSSHFLSVDLNLPTIAAVVEFRCFLPWDFLPFFHYFLGTLSSTISYLSDSRLYICTWLWLIDTIMRHRHNQVSWESIFQMIHNLWSYDCLGCCRVECIMWMVECRGSDYIAQEIGRGSCQLIDPGRLE